MRKGGNGRDENKSLGSNPFKKDVHLSQSQMRGAKELWKVELEKLALDPKPEGNTKEEQLDFRMREIDEALRKNFEIGNDSFRQLEIKIQAIKENLRRNKSIKDILYETKATLRLVELVTRDPELSNEDIDRELRQPIRDWRYKGISRHKLTERIELIRSLKDEPLAQQIRKSRASLYLIKLALEEKPKLSVDEIDQKMRAAPPSESEQGFGTGPFIEVTQHNIKRIKAEAETKSLDELIKKYSVSLKRIELAINIQGIVEDKALQEELKAKPDFDMGKLRQKITGIRSLAKSNLSNESFSSTACRVGAPLRLVVLARQEKLLTIEDIRREMQNSLEPDAKLSLEELGKKIQEIRSLLPFKNPTAENRSLEEIMRRTRSSSKLIELSTNPKRLDFANIQRGLNSAPVRIEPISESLISQIREKTRFGVHFLKISEDLNVSLKLIQLANAKVYVNDEKLILQKMTEHEEEEEKFVEAELKLSSKAFVKKVLDIRKLISEGMHPLAIQKELKASYQLMELAFREISAFEKLEYQLKRPSPPDPRFVGLTFAELKAQVGEIRARFAQGQGPRQIMDETGHSISLIELACVSPELELEEIDQRVRTLLPDRDFEGVPYQEIRTLVHHVREAQLTLKPTQPTLSPSPSLLPTLPLPELKTLPRAQIKVPRRPEVNYTYSANVRMQQAFQEGRSEGAVLTFLSSFKATKLEKDFEMMFKHRTPDAEQLYFFFKPLFQTVKAEAGEREALLVLHSKQNSKIRQSVIKHLLGVKKEGRSLAIKRLIGHKASNFIDLLELYLNGDENKKGIRDFILDFDQIFLEQAENLSLTKWGFQRLIAVFGLLQEKYQPLANIKEDKPSPTSVKLRKLCNPKKQGQLLVKILKKARGFISDNTINAVEEKEIVYWALEEGVGLYFIECYCLEEQKESLAHGQFFKLLKDKPELFAEMKHSSIQVMSFIFAGKHMHGSLFTSSHVSSGDDENKDISIDHTIVRQEDNLTAVIDQVFSKSESRSGSQELDEKYPSSARLAFDSTSKIPPNIIELALYFLNCKKNYSLEKTHEHLQEILNKGEEHFWFFARAVAAAPIFDLRHLDKKEALIGELAKVLAKSSGQLLHVFMAKFFAEKSCPRNKDAQLEFIYKFIQAAEQSFIYNILTDEFAYNLNERQRIRSIHELTTRLLGADKQLQGLLPQAASHGQEIAGIEEDIVEMLSQLSNISENAHFLRASLKDLSNTTVLKCVFVFPTLFSALKDSLFVSSFCKPGTPMTSYRPETRAALWQEHRKYIFLKIFNGEISLESFEKIGFDKLFYKFFNTQDFKNILTSGELSNPLNIYIFFETFLKQNDPEKFLESKASHSPAINNFLTWAESRKESSAIIQYTGRPYNHHLTGHSAPLVKFVHVNGSVMKGLLDLVKALPVAEQKKSLRIELCKVLERVLNNKTSCRYFFEIMNRADLLAEFAPLKESSAIVESKDTCESRLLISSAHQAFMDKSAAINLSPSLVRQIALFNWGLHWLGTGKLNLVEQDAVETWLKELWQRRNDLVGHQDVYIREFILLLVKWWPHQQDDKNYLSYLESFTQAADTQPLFKVLMRTIAVYLLNKTEEIDFDFVLMTSDPSLFIESYLELLKSNGPRNKLKPAEVIKFLTRLIQQFMRIDRYISQIHIRDQQENCPRFVKRLVELRATIITLFVEMNKAINLNINGKKEIVFEPQSTGAPSEVFSKTVEFLIRLESNFDLQRQLLDLMAKALQDPRFAIRFIIALTPLIQEPDSNILIDENIDLPDFGQDSNIFDESDDLPDFSDESKDMKKSQASKEKLREHKSSAKIEEKQISKIEQQDLRLIKGVHPKVIILSLHTLISQCRCTPHNLLPALHLERIKAFVDYYLQNMYPKSSLKAELVQKIQYLVWPHNGGSTHKLSASAQINSSNWAPRVDLYQFVCRLLRMSENEAEFKLAYSIEPLSQRLREEIIFHWVQQGVEASLSQLAEPEPVSLSESDEEDLGEIPPVRPQPMDQKEFKFSPPDSPEDSYTRLSSRGGKPMVGVVDIENKAYISAPQHISFGSKEALEQNYVYQLMIGCLVKLETQVLDFLAVKGNGFAALLESQYCALLKSIVSYNPNQKDGIPKLQDFVSIRKPFMHLQILYIFKDAFQEKLDENQVESQLKKVQDRYPQLLTSEASEASQQFLKKCFVFKNNYFGRLEAKIDRPITLVELTESEVRPVKLSALAAIGSTGKPIIIEDYDTLTAQSDLLELEFGQRLSVLALPRSVLSRAEIEAVLTNPPESVNLIVQVILRSFSLLGETCQPFLQSDQSLTLSAQLMQLFVRLQKGLKQQKQVDEEIQSLLVKVDENLELITWLQPCNNDAFIHLMQATILLQVAQAFESFIIHKYIAKAAIDEFQQLIQGLAPFDSSKNNHFFSIYDSWQTCYQYLFFLAKTILSGEIKRLGLNTRIPNRASLLQVAKKYQQILEAPFGYDDGESSQLEVVLRILSNASFRSELSGQQTLDWLKTFLFAWDRKFFPIISRPKDGTDFIHLLGKKIKMALMPPKEEKSKLVEMPAFYIEPQPESKRRASIPLVPLFSETDLPPILENSSLYGLWVKFVAVLPQSQQSKFLTSLKSGYRLLSDKDYQDHVAGETLRALIDIIESHDNVFQQYRLMQDWLKVFKEFEVDAQQPFDELFFKLKIKFTRFCNRYPFDYEQVIFAGICADFGYDVVTESASQQLLTSTDQEKLNWLIRKLIGDLFSKDKAEVTRDIMNNFGDQIRRVLGIHLQMLNGLISVLLPNLRLGQMAKLSQYLETSGLEPQKILERIYFLLVNIGKLNDQQNPELIANFISEREAELIQGLVLPKDEKSRDAIVMESKFFPLELSAAEDKISKRPILQELVIYSASRDIHARLESKVEWSQLDSRFIQREISDFWQNPNHLLAARMLHLLGIKRLSAVQCKFLFNTKSRLDILNAIVNRFAEIPDLDLKGLKQEDKPMVVFKHLLLVLLGKEFGEEVYGHLESIKEKARVGDDYSWVEGNVILCACIFSVHGILPDYKKTLASKVIDSLADTLVSTANIQQEINVFKAVFNVFKLLKDQNLAPDSDAWDNFYTQLRRYVQERGKGGLTSYHKVLYVYSFIYEQVVRAPGNSLPVKIIKELDSALIDWQNKIKDLITENANEFKEVKEVKEVKSVKQVKEKPDPYTENLKRLLCQARKMLCFSLQYPGIASEGMANGRLFLAPILEAIVKGIDSATNVNSDEPIRFSTILEFPLLHKYIEDLELIREVFGDDFMEHQLPAWTRICWLFSQKEKSFAEIAAGLFIKFSLCERLAKEDYLKLNCVIDYIEERAEKENGEIADRSLRENCDLARTLIGESAPDGSPIRQRFIAEQSIAFIKNGSPEILSGLWSKGGLPSEPLVVKDELKEEKSKGPEQHLIKLLIKSYKAYFTDELALEKLNTVLQAIDSGEMKHEIKNYCFNTVKLLFSQLGADKNAKNRWLKWGRLLEKIANSFLVPDLQEIEEKIEADSKGLAGQAVLFPLQKLKKCEYQFENGRTWRQQFLVEVLLAFQNHMLTSKLDDTARLQLIFLLKSAGFEESNHLNEDAWEKYLGENAYKELSRLIILYLLGITDLLQALGVSYSVSSKDFRLYSEINQGAASIIQKSFIGNVGADCSVDSVIKFSTWYDKEDSLSILLSSLLNLVFAAEHSQVAIAENKKILVSLLQRTDDAEEIYKRVVTLLFTAFKDFPLFSNSLMDYLSLDLAMWLKRDMNADDAIDFPVLAKTIQDRMHFTYNLWARISNPHGLSETILEYVAGLIANPERTHGFNINFYGMYELLRNTVIDDAEAKSEQTQALDENVIRLIDGTANILLGEDSTVNLRTCYRALMPVLEVKHQESKESELSHVLSLDLNLAEVFNRLITVAGLDEYMRSRLSNMFAKTADYLRHEILKQGMQGLSSQYEEKNLISALLHNQWNEINKLLVKNKFGTDVVLKTDFGILTPVIRSLFYQLCTPFYNILSILRFIKPSEISKNFDLEKILEEEDITLPDPLFVPLINKINEFVDSYMPIAQNIFSPSGDVWPSLVNVLATSKTLAIMTNPKDDKLCLVIDPFKYQEMLAAEQKKSGGGFCFSLFSGGRRGLLPSRQLEAVNERRANRQVNSDSKAAFEEEDVDVEYFSSPAEYLRSPEAEVGLLKQLVDVIPQDSIKALYGEIKALIPAPTPVVLLQKVYTLLLSFISPEDKILQPLVSGIYQDIGKTIKTSSPKKVIWFVSEFLIKPFIDLDRYKIFYTLIFDKLLAWAYDCYGREADTNSLNYVSEILALGVVLKKPVEELLGILDPVSDLDEYKGVKLKFREESDIDVPFELAKQAVVLKMSLGEDIDLVPLIEHFLEQKDQTADTFFECVYSNAHNARSVITVILEFLSFDTEKRYISDKTVKSASQALEIYLQEVTATTQSKNVVYFSLIDLLKRYNEVDLAFSCKDELQLVDNLQISKKRIASSLVDVFPDLLGELEEHKKEEKVLDKETRRRHKHELPYVMSRYLENYLMARSKEVKESKEDPLKQIHPAWQFALNKYNLLVKLKEFFIEVESCYKNETSSEDLVDILNLLGEIFGVSFKQPSDMANIHAFKEMQMIFSQALTLTYLYIEKSISDEIGIFKWLKEAPELEARDRGRIMETDQPEVIYELINKPKQTAIELFRKEFWSHRDVLTLENSKFLSYVYCQKFPDAWHIQSLKITYPPQPKLSFWQSADDDKSVISNAIIPIDATELERYKKFVKKFPIQAERLLGPDTFLFFKNIIDLEKRRELSSELEIKQSPGPATTALPLVPTRVNRSSSSSLLDTATLSRSTEIKNENEDDSLLDIFQNLFDRADQNIQASQDIYIQREVTKPATRFDEKFTSLSDNRSSTFGAPVARSRSRPTTPTVNNDRYTRVPSRSPSSSNFGQVEDDFSSTTGQTVPPLRELSGNLYTMISSSPPSPSNSEKGENFEAVEIDEDTSDYNYEG